MATTRWYIVWKYYTLVKKYCAFYILHVSYKYNEVSKYSCNIKEAMNAYHDGFYGKVAEYYL